MPDASLYATMAYALTVLALGGYAGVLLRRIRGVDRRLGERAGATGTQPEEASPRVTGAEEDWLVRTPAEPPPDVPEVSRVP